MKNPIALRDCRTNVDPIGPDSLKTQIALDDGQRAKAAVRRFDLQAIRVMKKQKRLLVKG
jgi:hypothetical protein